ncbi:MAG: hypothetical protein IIZ90_01510, partial [Bacteroidales bacterium]|nr:hypothetical protein [Bacteroidales bacterium]
YVPAPIERGVEISLTETPSTIKIGYNTGDNTCKFNYDPSNKPVLYVKHGENKADLENIPAIRRIQ